VAWRCLRADEDPPSRRLAGVKGQQRRKRRAWRTRLNFIVCLSFPVNTSSLYIPESPISHSVFLLQKETYPTTTRLLSIGNQFLSMG
jgi:hypothetical protein